MKIVDVEAYTVHTPIKHPWIWRQGLPGSPPVLETTWLRIITDEGVEGWNSVRSGAIALDIIRRRLKPELIGKDPMYKEFLWQRMWEIDRIEEFPIYILGAVDTALWDLLSRKAGVRLYQLMGGYRDKIPAYASTVTFRDTREYLDVADQCIEYGFKAIKLHAWGDARKDAQLCLDLRKHVGPDIALMYDGSAGFNPYDALYVGKACQEAGYYFYEEPMREFSINQYKRLCDDLEIPVLSAETSDGCHFNAADFIIAGACDMLRTEVTFKGGFTGGLRIAHLADSFQMTAEVHGSGLPQVQLALSIPNTTYYESLVRCNPIEVESGIDHDGNIAAPDRPGIGWDIDLKDIQKRAVARL